MQTGGPVGVGVGAHSAMYLEATLAQQVPGNTTVHVYVLTLLLITSYYCAAPIHY